MSFGSNEGKKISAYPKILINSGTYKNRIDYKTYFFGYANVKYGTKIINKNYQIPMDAVRNDIWSYVGVENIKPGWRDMLSFWNGNWYNQQDATKSYLKYWNKSEENDPDYIKDKFQNKEKNDKVFILKNAPIPMEEGYDDSGEENEYYQNKENEEQLQTQKIVNKTYIDNRFNGCRVINSSIINEDGKETAIINLRPYSCYYYIDQPVDQTSVVTAINFKTSQYDVTSTVEDKLKKKRTAFYIRLKHHGYYFSKTNKSNLIEFRLNGVKENVLFDNMSLRSLFITPKSFYYLKCEMFLDNGQLYVLIKSDGNVPSVLFDEIDNKRRIKYLEIGSETQNIPLYEYDEKPNGDTFITELNGHVETVTKTDLSTDSEGNQVITEYEELDWVDCESNIISFDVKDPTAEADAEWAFDNNIEYSWNFFIRTPNLLDPNLITNKDVPIRININDSENSIIWAQSEDPTQAPKLNPNKLYCFEFTKLTNGIFIGRIKYFISLLKKNHSDI